MGFLDPADEHDKRHFTREVALAALITIAAFVSVLVVQQIELQHLPKQTPTNYATIQQVTGCAACETLIIDSYNFPVGGPLTVMLKNVGSATQNLANADYFVNGIRGTFSGNCDTVLASGDSCRATIVVPVSGLVSGQPYDFQIYTPSGPSEFSYSVVYGGSS